MPRTPLIYTGLAWWVDPKVVTGSVAPSAVCIFSSVHPALDNRVFYREARSLQKAGYRVTLIAVHPGDEMKDGVQIIGLPQVPRWERPMLWIKVVQEAVQTKADIYHFHDPELLFVAPIIRALTRKPVIYDIHEVYADFFAVKDYLPGWVRYPLAWIFRWLEPLLARMQSGLIFADEQIAANFSTLPIPKATIYNYPGNFLIQAGLEEAPPGTPRPSLVLHLGGHERNRGTGLMIAAFAQVVRRHPSARLRLVGHFVPPALEDEVRADIHQFGLEEKVEITGQVPFETVGEHLRQAAVGWVAWQAFPKNQKNIPTKVFEYMAYGIPIVASNLSSIREYVEPGLNGWLVEPADPAAHAKAILDLLDNPDQAVQMGEHGRQLVQSRHNWDVMEKRLLDFYTQFCPPKDHNPVG